MEEWEELSGKMALENLNGRQIRDVVRIAHASAFGDKSPITTRHLQDAIDSLRTFEKEFEKGRKPLEKAGEPRGRKRPRRDVTYHKGADDEDLKYGDLDDEDLDDEDLDGVDSELVDRW